MKRTKCPVVLFRSHGFVDFECLPLPCLAVTRRLAMHVTYERHVLVFLWISRAPAVRA